MDKEKIDNVYAFNVKNEIVYIEHVEKGRKGYFCMGCKAQMQAVKPQKRNIRAYFRHDVKYSQGKGQCTFRDETYRHKLAKEILQIEKRIKVPALYKYPPKGVNGAPNFISESGYIVASSVSIELYFFENDNGEILFGKGESFSDEKHLLVKPDVTFFDHKGDPILFIEITATHKIDDTKRNKYKRLGIDAVEVIIPKDSPEEIGRTFHITERTKWIYSHEHEKREYIFVPISHTEGVQPVDELQRKFFEESFKCRAAQIGNLIYAIEICLGSEQFMGIKRTIESEISRVERNTTNAQIEWEGICQARINEVETIIGEEKERLRISEESIISEEIEFQKESEDLEKRYFRKRREIDENIAKQQPKGTDFEREIERIEKAIREHDDGIRKIISYREYLDSESGKFEGNRDRIIGKFEGFKKQELRDFRNRKSGIESRISDTRQSNQKAESDFDDFKRRIRKELEHQETESINEYSSRLREQIERIQKGEIDGIEFERQISRKINDFADAMGLLENISSIYKHRERYQSAVASIKSGAFKNWHDRNKIF